MNLFSEQLAAAIAEGRAVLAPSRRTARAIQLAYARHARRSGRRAWRTPDVLTTSAWLERTFARERARESLFSPRLIPAAHVAALWDRIVAASPIAPALATPRATARIAERAWRRAIDWQIPTARIAADAGDEACALVGWITAFEDFCAAREWLPAARIPQWLMHRGTAVSDRLLIMQPADLTPLHRSLFAMLRTQGTEIAEGVGTPASIVREVCAARNGLQELTIAAAWARGAIESGMRSIGVVVTDLADRIPEVRRAFEDAFAPGLRCPSGQPVEPAFEIAASVNLDRFTPVSAALELLLVSHGGAHHRIGRLLRSAYVGGASSEAPARARLELSLRRDPREYFDLGTLERLASGAGCPLFAARTAAVRALARGQERLLPSRWAERFLALLHAFGWPGDRASDSAERQTLEKFAELLSSFGALDDVFGTLPFDDARREFAGLVVRTSFEPRTPAAPVTVIDAETVSGMRFEAVWLAGMDAARWPPAPDPDPLLPIALQIEAAFPQATPTAAREAARRRFDALLAAAPRVIASWAQWDADAEQQPSPWVGGWARAQLAAPVRTAYRLTLFDRRPVLERRDDPGAPQVIARRVRGGARVLELQALCPFRAQAELRLHARPLEAGGPEVDPLERGQLAHAVLDDLWQALASHAALKALDETTLTHRVRQLVETRAQPLLAGASPHRARLVAIEIELASARILELCRRERERLPFRVHERPEIRELFRIGGLELELRIDRVDRLETGELVVIDYKTGTSAKMRDWFGERPRQPQLPLYALVYRDAVIAVAYGLLGRGRVGFEGLAREAGVLPGVRRFDPRSAGVAVADWAHLLASWQADLESLANAFVAGRSATVPLPQACRTCHLAALCRVHEDGLHVDDDEPSDDGG